MWNSARYDDFGVVFGLAMAVGDMRQRHQRDIAAMARLRRLDRRTAVAVQDLEDLRAVERAIAAMTAKKRLALRLALRIAK